MRPAQGTRPRVGDRVIARRAPAAFAREHAPEVVLSQARALLQRARPILEVFDGDEGTEGATCHDVGALQNEIDAFLAGLPVTAQSAPAGVLALLEEFNDSLNIAQGPKWSAFTAALTAARVAAELAPDENPPIGSELLRHAGPGPGKSWKVTSR